VMIQRHQPASILISERLSDNEGRGYLGAMHCWMCCVQLEELCDASRTGLAAYVNKHGPGCLELVTLLLEKGADPNALAGPLLGQYTPLHVVSYWRGGEAGQGRQYR
jgi:hypothetical protein